MSNKYSNILTMFLVVLIVAIVGIIGYFTYDSLNSKKIDTNAKTALEEFEKATTSIKKDNTNASTSENIVNEEIKNPLDELNNLQQNQNTVKEEEKTKKEPEKVYLEGYEIKGRIQIPKTGVDYPVLQSPTRRSLELAVAIAYGPGLNVPGNTCIYGHNYRNKLFFSENDKLVKGDKIIITDQMGEKVTYIIYNIYQTTPNDATYMTRPVEEGKREISLQTCTDDNSGRIIIWAAEQ